jgi:hypothetical protein
VYPLQVLDRTYSVLSRWKFACFFLEKLGQQGKSKLKSLQSGANEGDSHETEQLTNYPSGKMALISSQDIRSIFLCVNSTRN